MFLSSRSAACERAAGPSVWAMSVLVTGRSSPELGGEWYPAGRSVVAERPDPAHEHPRTEAGGAIHIGWVVLGQMGGDLEAHADGRDRQVLVVRAREVAGLGP